MSTALMAPRKNKRSEASKAIVQAIMDQYQPTNVKEAQDALTDPNLAKNDCYKYAAIRNILYNKGYSVLAMRRMIMGIRIRITAAMDISIKM